MCVVVLIYIFSIDIDFSEGQKNGVEIYQKIILICQISTTCENHELDPNNLCMFLTNNIIQMYPIRKPPTHFTKNFL